MQYGRIDLNGNADCQSRGATLEVDKRFSFKPAKIIMRRAGHVEVANDELSARCLRCKKSIMYQQGMNFGMWKEVLKSFVSRHRECPIQN